MWRSNSWEARYISFLIFGVYNTNHILLETHIDLQQKLFYLLYFKSVKIMGI